MADFIEPSTRAALGFDCGQLTEALHSGDLKLEGDRTAVARFLFLFPRPEPAAPALGMQHRSIGREPPGTPCSRTSENTLLRT
jgi:hypothetical protein